MAQINITIPDAKLAKVLNSFAGTYGYKETVIDQDGNEVPNPETKGQFAKRQIVEFVKNVVHSYAVNVNVAAAREGTVEDDSIAS